MRGMAGGIAGGEQTAIGAMWWWLALLACAMQLVQRAMLASRLRTSMVGALLHPLGVVLMTAIQWYSWFLHMSGKRTWRGRDAGGNVAPA